MPGTELAFAGEVACLPTGLLGWKTKTINHRTAIFRQVNKDKLAAHHDALEFPDGRTGSLTLLAKVRRQQCFSYLRSQRPRLRSMPRSASRTWSDMYRPVEAALKSGLFFTKPPPCGSGRYPFSQCLKREFRPLMYEIAQKRNLTRSHHS